MVMIFNQVAFCRKAVPFLLILLKGLIDPFQLTCVRWRACTMLKAKRVAGGNNMGAEKASSDAAKKPLGGRVSSLIKVHLARGKVGVETVAGQLNMSRYTLHKKLRQEGVTFAALLEQVRREQAITYMKDKSKPLVEIAEQLGFSELSAFSRAFKRWMGTPPAEYRSLRMS